MGGGMGGGFGGGMGGGGLVFSGGGKRKKGDNIIISNYHF